MKDIENGDTVDKKKAEMEEVKQAIKDMQIEIAHVNEKTKKVETDIEAMKNELFGDKLSPLKESLLTKMIDSLIDEKKALMDEKKALMDEKKALMDKEKALTNKEKKALMNKEKKALMNKEKKALMDEKKALMNKEKALMDEKKNRFVTNIDLSSAPRPFELIFDVVEDFPLHGGGNAIFKRKWLIDTIAEMVLKKVEGSKFGSYYWRAPFGSGKTVFLKLIGKELQSRGCIVYNILFSPKMDLIPDGYFHKLAKEAGDKTVVVLIDEVQLNLNSFHWDDLLKGNKPSNLLVLGVGIPRLNMISAQFSWKFPRDDDQYPMFLTRSDLPEVIAYFTKQSKRPEETVALICDQVLHFTSGQLFPFVTIMKYVLDPGNNVDVANITTHLNTEIFRTSQAYEHIKRRCVDLQGIGIFEAATNVLSNKGSVGDFD